MTWVLRYDFHLVQGRSCLSKPPSETLSAFGGTYGFAMHATRLLHMQEAIEEFVASSAECIYVGKRGQKPSAKQSDIDALLVDWCLQVCYCMHS